MRFYRAAPSVNPWFAFGSFWTPDKAFAEWFAKWLTNPDPIYVALKAVREPLKDPDEVAIYVADVDDGDVVQLFPPGGVLELAPERVLGHAYKYMARGVQWLLFHEGFVEGRLWVSAIYIGSEPVPAERV
jgi:hypothetical protein